MRRDWVQLPVPGTDLALTVVAYGHWGRPLLVFPSEAGGAWDYENNGMVGAVADLIDAGRVKLYCVDSLDAFTWSDRSLALEERARRHATYAAWVRDVVAPWIHGDCGGPVDIAVTGCSLGAYHALQCGLTRADLFPLVIGLSGNYDVSTWHAWGERGRRGVLRQPGRLRAEPARRPPRLAARPAVRAAGLRAGGVGDASDRSAAGDPGDGAVVAGQGYSLRGGPLGLRSEPRLGVVAAAARPSPAAVLLGLLDLRP